ncbi:MAG: transposase [Planctomycetes bacterium]|nr:transposase [Planctomycetota bacterium]
MASDRDKETADTGAGCTNDQPPEAASRVYFDPLSPVGRLKGNLPHWRQDGATYFVTFRLADSIPQAKLRQWITERKQWLELHPAPHDTDLQREFNQLFTQRFLKWLDAGYGECILAGPDVRGLVADALRHFDGQRYRLADWVIMPNHVHMLVSPIGDRKLSSVLQSLKSFTAHGINRLLGRRGTIWQKESFDHIVRSVESFLWIARYIQDNPRSLGSATYTLNAESTFELS